MKNIKFIVLIILITSIFSLTKLTSVSSEEKNEVLTSILEKKCIQCHGAVVDGKKKVKGKVDLTNISKNGIRVVDSGLWVKVVDAIESGEMPPEKSKRQLEGDEKNLMLKQIHSALNQKSVEERMLTPLEITNSMSQLFGVDKKRYNSFIRLKFNANPLVQYPTVESMKMVSTNFLKDLDYAFDAMAERFVLPRKSYRDRSQPGPDTFKADFSPDDGAEGPHGPMVFIDRDFSTLPAKPRAPQNQTPEEYKEFKKILNAWGIKLKKYNEDNAEKINFDIRKRGTGEKGGNVFIEYKPWPKYTEYKSLPAGKYKMSFKATALNRSKVSKAYNSGFSKKIMDKFKHYGWESLINEKCRLDIAYHGTHSNYFKSLAPNSVRGSILKSFEIEDDVVKTYSCEFELQQPNSFTFDFGNGPTSGRQVHLSLPNAKKRKEKQRGNARWGRPGREYEMPCIRILSPIHIEKISAETAKSPFDVKFIDDLTEDEAKKRLSLYSKMLSISHAEPKAFQFFDGLSKKLSVSKRYALSLKLLTMSPEHLFINLFGDIEADARYVSYSLLKTHPSKSFKRDFSLYRSGKLSSSAFAEKIVKDPNFNSFVDKFVEEWLGYGVVLDEVKYTKALQHLPFNKETKVYVHQLFKNNRPAAELFDSDYALLNNSLASYYGLQSKDLEYYTYKMTKTPTSHRGGVLNQGSFFISKSSGVDPLPFRRAAWISENIFDVKLPDPPSNVNTNEFVASEQAKTFKDRTLIHAENEQCQGCHKKIDPIAFAMHNFDTMGRRIEKQDREAEAEFKQKVLSANKTIAAAFTRHLISYIIGRETTVFDKSSVTKIVTKTEKNGYRLRDVLGEIINVYFK